MRAVERRIPCEIATREAHASRFVAGASPRSWPHAAAGDRKRRGARGKTAGRSRAGADAGSGDVRDAGLRSDIDE
jgi:hypothetical protein